MKARRRLVRIGLILVFAVPIAGCTPGLKLNSRRTCESAGGTYTGLTCHPNIPAGAEQMCMANGGVFLAGEDYCDIPFR